MGGRKTGEQKCDERSFQGKSYYCSFLSHSATSTSHSCSSYSLTLTQHGTVLSPPSAASSRSYFSFSATNHPPNLTTTISPDSIQCHKFSFPATTYRLVPHHCHTISSHCHYLFSLPLPLHPSPPSPPTRLPSGSQSVYGPPGSTAPSP